MTEGTKVALVTGCSSGIGKATAWALAEVGYRVYATSRRLVDMEQVMREAEQSKLSLHARTLDVTSQESIDAVIAEIERVDGRLDVLVNNAGYALIGSVEDLPMEDIRKQYDVNVFGLLAVYKTAVPLMRRSGGGTIVNISSVAGRVSAPLMGVYCSTKFAVEALSLAMSGEVHQFGIRVVAVEPGPVNTRFAETAMEASGHVVNRNDSPYSNGYVKLRDFYGEPYGYPPERVARVILRAVRAKRPRTRYTVRGRERLYAAAGALVATKVGQRLIRGYFDLKPEKSRQLASAHSLIEKNQNGR